jgi:acyl-[acyl-carrier-protein]-phospholipid O-acyltransferase/long-chain-fatty-acid--[acyl-carrier-protein] ligase
MTPPTFHRRSYLPYLLELVGIAIARVLYRVRSSGAGNIPASGGVLLIANHLSYVDVVVLQLACPRRVRFVGFQGLQRHWFFDLVLRWSGTIPISARHPTEGMKAAVRTLRAGELVCVFPEGHISRTGQLMRIMRGFEVMARHANVPVVPAAIDGLWGSVFSFAGNKYLWKSPRLMRTAVFVAFGQAVPAAEATTAWARKALLDLGAAAFEERPNLRRHVAREIVRALARRPWRVEIVDRTAERRTLSAAQLLGVAAVLGRRWRTAIPEKRVGIVLPPGIGAFIANLAVMAAGKIPVNLNFTAGRGAIEASLRLGEVETVISAEAMRAKVADFPWPQKTLDLVSEIKAAGGKRAVLPWLLAAWVLPNQWFASALGLPRRGDREEAALLFTSGSAGEPKGVPLTHRNILANCAQISSLSILPRTCTLLGCLPLFHSFGFTVTLWYAMLRGSRVVTIPSPLDTRKMIDAIRDDKVTVVVAAPTFVRPLLKKATSRELRSLDLVVTGAEKLQDDLANGFLETFHIEILQGYGLTETSPVTNVNQPHPPVLTDTAEPQIGKKTASVGRLLPGLTARIGDPDTGKERPLTETGVVWFRGANIFPGYLKDEEKTRGALRNGWFVTGDIGRFDEDGFLYIEGRLSRFSKVGGEMVPHGTIEQKTIEAFELDQTEGPPVVVTSVPDPVKGEALVLLSTRAMTTEELRTRLLAAGLPNLWVPKLVCKVDRIPVLGTGKTDHKTCRALAIELAAQTAGA